MSLLTKTRTCVWPFGCTPKVDTIFFSRSDIFRKPHATGAPPDKFLSNDTCMEMYIKIYIARMKMLCVFRFIHTQQPSNSSSRCCSYLHVIWMSLEIKQKNQNELVRWNVHQIYKIYTFSILAEQGLSSVYLRCMIQNTEYFAKLEKRSLCMEI